MSQPYILCLLLFHECHILSASWVFTHSAASTECHCLSPKAPWQSSSGKALCPTSLLALTPDYNHCHIFLQWFFCFVLFYFTNRSMNLGLFISTIQNNLMHVKAQHIIQKWMCFVLFCFNLDRGKGGSGSPLDFRVEESKIPRCQHLESKMNK